MTYTSPPPKTPHPRPSRSLIPHCPSPTKPNQIPVSSHLVIRHPCQLHRQNPQLHLHIPLPPSLAPPLFSPHSKTINTNPPPQQKHPLQRRILPQQQQQQQQQQTPSLPTPTPSPQNLTPPAHLHHPHHTRPYLIPSNPIKPLFSNFPFSPPQPPLLKQKIHFNVALLYIIHPYQKKSLFQNPQKANIDFFFSLSKKPFIEFLSPLLFFLSWKEEYVRRLGDGRIL